MLYMIPIVIGVSLVLGYSLSPDHTNLEARSSDTLESNLILQHRQAVNIAKETHMSSGAIDSAISGPFRKMGEWESEVLTDDGRTVVLTYIPESLENLDKESVRAFNSITEVDLKGLPESYFGPYAYGSTGGYIGEGDFTGMTLPLVANYPAIVTVIDYSLADSAGSEAGGEDGGDMSEAELASPAGADYVLDLNSGAAGSAGAESGGASTSNGKNTGWSHSNKHNHKNDHQYPGWSHSNGIGSQNSAFNR